MRVRVNNSFNKVLIFLLFFLSLSLPALAIRIDKPRIRVELEPNESYSGSITVSNYSLEPADVRVYLEDFIYVEPYDGYKDFFPPGMSSFSLFKWINFSPQEFKLEPYGSKTVRFVIRPDEAIDHVHCGILLFETVVGTTYDESGALVSVLGRVGSLIFIEPPGAKKAVAIKDVEGSPRKIKAKFIDSGDTFIHARGTFYLLDADGVPSDRGQLNELFLLPGDQAQMEINVRDSVSAGDYTAILTIDLEDNDIIVREIDFSLKESGEVEILEVRE